MPKDEIQHKILAYSFKYLKSLVLDCEPKLHKIWSRTSIVLFSDRRNKITDLIIEHSDEELEVQFNNDLERYIKSLFYFLFTPIFVTAISFKTIYDFRNSVAIDEYQIFTIALTVFVYLYSVRITFLLILCLIFRRIYNYERARHRQTAQ